MNITKTQYNNLMKRQTTLTKKVEDLERLVKTAPTASTDEVRFSYIKKLNSLSKDMDEGNGTRITSKRSLGKYMARISGF